MDTRRRLRPAIRILAIVVVVAAIMTTAPTPIDAQTAPGESSALVVRAFGSTGQEILEVVDDGEVVATQLVGTEPSDFAFKLDEGTAITDVELRFPNDLFRNSVDRNLHVDYVELDGIRYETEAPSTYSTGSWTSATGCSPGYKLSETLHCIGTLSYGHTVITVRLRGNTGEEIVAIAADGETLAEIAASREWTETTTAIPNGLDVDVVSVGLTNDRVRAGRDRNVEVDWVEVDGDRLQAESPLVYSTGSWDSASGCAPGRKTSQTINCNGGLDFLFPEPGDTVVRARVRGQTGDEIFEIRHGDTVLVHAEAPRRWTEFVSVVDGHVAEDVAVAFTNDFYIRGYDRNLEVDWLEIGYVRIEAEAETTFSTGTWTSERGCADGTWRSEILHCTGALIFAPVEPMDNTGAVVVEDGNDTTNKVVIGVALTPPAGMDPTSMKISTGSLRRAAWVRFDESTTVDLAGEDGLRRISAQFRDDRGNVTPVFFDEIVLKRTGPDVEIESVDPGQVIDLGEDGTQTGSFELAGAVDSDAEKVVVRAGDEQVEVPVEDGRFELDVSAPTSGEHTYEVVTRDSLGNESIEAVTVEVEVPGPGDTIYQPELIMDGTLSSSVVAFDPEGLSIELDRDFSSEITPGNILPVAPNAHMPEGHLGHVVEVTVNDGHTMVRTEHATLDDAFRQLEFEIGDPADAADNASPPPVDGVGAAAARANSGLRASRSFSLDRTIVEGNVASLRTEGSLTTTAYANGSLEWDCSWLFCNPIPKWNFNLTGSARAQLEIIANAEASLTRTKTIYSGPIGSPIQIGPVTLVVRGTIDLIGHVAGEAEVRSGVFRGGVTGGINIRRNSPAPFAHITESTPGIASATGSADAYAYVRVGLGVYAYDAIGGDVRATIGPRLTATVDNGNVNGAIYLDGKVDVLARLQVPKVGREVARFGPATIYSDQILLRRFSLKAPEPSTPTIPENPTNPGNPNNPGTPNNPGNPNNPGTPTNPTNPGNPGDGPTLTVSRGGTTNVGSCGGSIPSCRWIHGSGHGWPAREQYWIRCGDFVDTGGGLPVGITYAPRTVSESGTIAWSDRICASAFSTDVEVYTQSGIRKTVPAPFG